MSYINNKDRIERRIEDYIEERTPDLNCDIPTKEKFNKIIECCKKNGLDGFDYIYEFFNFEEISELAAYGGFPVRFPHYSFGAEFEKLNQSYTYGYSKIYEMIVNSNPAFAFLLNSNTEIDNATVIAHAYAHNDFFKNNVWYSKTNRNMMNEMASHGTKIRRYCSVYGRNKVIRFLDLAMAIQWLINPDDAMSENQNDIYYETMRKQEDMPMEEPRKIQVQDNHEYMDDFVNPEGYIKEERQRIKDEYNNRLQSFPEEPTRDVIGFIAQHSPRLMGWMRDVLFMMREEALYYMPQAWTQTLNEGWASYWDEKIMVEEGFAGDSGIIDYAQHHAGVIGGKYSRNPYAIGNMLLKYVKDKWDKGKFGEEWEQCQTFEERKSFDRKLNKGTEKLFEIRSLYNDHMLIDEFMDQDFCDEYEFYKYESLPDGRKQIVSKDADEIKKEILKNKGSNSFPVIRIFNANGLNSGHLCLEQVWTGRPMSIKYSEETLKFISRLWGRPAMLKTYIVNKNFNQDIPLELNDAVRPIVIVAVDGNKVLRGTYEQYLNKSIFENTKKE